MTNILQLAIRVSSVVSLSTLSKLIKWTLIEWLIEWLCVSETRNSPNCHGSGSAVGVGEESAELWRRRSLQSVCISARLRSTSRPREAKKGFGLGKPSETHPGCNTWRTWRGKKVLETPQTRNEIGRHFLMGHLQTMVRWETNVLATVDETVDDYWYRGVTV